MQGFGVIETAVNEDIQKQQCPPDLDELFDPSTAGMALMSSSPMTRGTVQGGHQTDSLLADSQVAVEASQVMSVVMTDVISV